MVEIGPRARLAFVRCAIGFVGFLVLAAGVSATPPCPAFTYAVSIRSYGCQATLYEPTASFPLGALWWSNPWKNGSYERVADHLVIAPSETERIVFEDADGDASTTPSDAIRVWSPGGCHTLLGMGFGADPGNLSDLTPIFLEPGYLSPCAPRPVDLVTPTAIAVVAAALVGPLFLVYRLTRRVR